MLLLNNRGRLRNKLTAALEAEIREQVAKEISDAILAEQRTRKRLPSDPIQRGILAVQDERDRTCAATARRIGHWR